MNLSLFLARRFFRSKNASADDTQPNGKKKGAASTPAIHIATIGIALGLAVMMLSVCIVRGFQHEISSRITGFGSHIEVVDFRAFASPEAYPLTVTTDVKTKIEKTAGVAQVQTFADKIGILKTEDDFAAIQLKGVGTDYDISFIRSHIVEGKLPTLTDTATTNDIVISKDQADALKLKVGDRVFAYFFEKTVKMRRFHVAAIYDTGMKQFDKTFALTDIATVRKLNDWTEAQASGYEIRVQDFNLLEQTEQNVMATAKGLNDPNGGTYNVLSIKENPHTASVFGWLRLLDMNIWVILILVLLVAGFSMISGLLILILERTNTIGVLKALGMTNARLRHTFLYYAAFIIVRGLVIGNVLALALICAQKQWGFLKLDPETYYVATVPVEFNALIFVLLNVATFLVTLAALIVPSYMVSRIQPAKAIRFD